MHAAFVTPNAASAVLAGSKIAPAISPAEHARVATGPRMAVNIGVSAARRRWDFEAAQREAAATVAAPPAKKLTAAEIAQLPAVLFEYPWDYFNPPPPPPAPGKSADEYVAWQETLAFRARVVAPHGVYTPQATEGASAYETIRAGLIANNRDYREKQKSAYQKSKEMYENRRLAITASGNNSNAERYFVKFPSYAKEFVARREEEINTYGGGANPDCDVAEGYIADTFYRAYKREVTPGGVYAADCQDGAAKGQAEVSRNLALSFAFRAQQQDASRLTKASYVVPAHARNDFGRNTHDEESLFNRFPTIGAAINPQ